MCGNSNCEKGENPENCLLDCSDDGNTFGIYTANIDGSGLKPILTSGYRMINHAYPSPDGEWIVFTRYNNKGANGCAEETGGNYFDTEVVVARVDGSVVKPLFPPDPSKVRVLGSWSEDMSNIVYVYSDDVLPKFMRAFLDSEMNVVSEEEIVVQKEALGITAMGLIDPFQKNGKISFVATFTSSDYAFPVKGVFIMDGDGSNLKLLSLVRDLNGAALLASTVLENDPHISPDGSKVAFMRRINNVMNFRAFVVEVDDPFNEKNISEQHLGNAPAIADAVPTWIDNETLLIWHLDYSNAANLKQQIYTMAADGSERKKVALPDGMLYNQPSLFSGSGKNARIIFATLKPDRVCS